MEEVNERLKAVRYEDFGAQGDGKTDDMGAIAKAHAFANQHGLPVKVEADATYYIGATAGAAVIRTDTDFGSARFVIDDTVVEERGLPVFLVESKLPLIELDGVTSLTKNQSKVDVSLSHPCVVTVFNDAVKRYIRYGANQNHGQSQRDVFLVDRDGRVDAKTPILWDFDNITKITATPVDSEPLTLKGGRFTTIANAAESKYTYYSRGIAVRRSNVVMDGLEHRITGEGEQGAPYHGFLSIANCANVTVQNCILSGHKTYRTIGSAGRPVSMGSYDITVNSGLNVSLINCKQANDIKDGKLWGIMASNYSKNLLYDGCTLSRFDAHQGVANATIRNSTLGHAGINAIGCGTFLVEDTTVYGRTFINLRSDYGSTWEGEFMVRNCTFVPACGRPVSASLIGGANSGKHDFGYTCYMPKRMVVESLHINDQNHPAEYLGPTIFAAFNKAYTDASYVEDYPYITTEQVVLMNVTTASGKALRLSETPFMFKDVKVIRR